MFNPLFDCISAVCFFHHQLISALLLSLFPFTPWWTLPALQSWLGRQLSKASQLASHKVRASHCLAMSSSHVSRGPFLAHEPTVGNGLTSKARLREPIRNRTGWQSGSMVQPVEPFGPVDPACRQTGLNWHNPVSPENFSKYICYIFFSNFTTSFYTT